MTKYALVYQRLNVTTRKPETVVSHYAGNGTLAIHHFEYIAAPMNEAQATLVAQGWQYRNTPGPQSVLMQHA
jgi:hypothetical protein